MKKLPLITALAILFIMSVWTRCHAIATIGGTITGINPGEKRLVIKLQSGAEKTVVLTGNAKAYKMNQPAILSHFRVGEYVVVKIANPLNEDPWHGELLMDTYSNQQYSAYRTIKPVFAKKHGGYMTSAGAAASSNLPLQGVYPNAKGPGPGRIPPPAPGQWDPSGSAPVGTGPLKAAPSPWGSPFIGAALSPSHEGNSGGGGSMMYDTGPSSPKTTVGGVNYNTGPAGVSSDPGPLPNQSNNPGITPDQASWVTKPTTDAPTRRMITLQGRIRTIDDSFTTVQLEELNGSTVYVVTLKRNTKITDYTTGMDIPAAGLQIGKVVNLTGIAVSSSHVDAITIQIQR